MDRITDRDRIGETGEEQFSGPEADRNEGVVVGPYGALWRMVHVGEGSSDASIVATRRDEGTAKDTGLL